MASPVVPTSPADDGNTPPSPPASAAEVAFGHFLVPRRADGTLWELGRGAMGVTYRAFDTSLRTEVALKVIRADQVSEEAARRRFQREARAAAKIRHPNIASVLYLGEQGGEFFYAMEFIAGRSLEVLLKENAAGPLPPLVAVALAAQAAAALNAAHKREVVHRDLKPANLMLLEGDALDHEDERTEAAGNRQLKIIDFGLARSFGANRQDDSLVTQTFAGFIGTPAYASPEQASGAADLDGRSDLYSLGVILWQGLTGRLPFTGRVVEVLGKHQFQPPPVEQLAAANVPAPLVDLLTGLLAKNPAERQPQIASDLRSTLDRLLRTLAADAEANAAAIAAGAVPTPAAAPEIIERTSDTTTTPGVGTTLLERYRLGREVAQGDGGRLFLAADNAQEGRAVALKLLAPERLSAEPGFLGSVETALEKARQHPHPVLLALLSPGLARSGNSAAFFVREWAEGFSLDELLRARHGELRAAEVFRLLDRLPAALDFTAAHNVPLLEVALRKLFVVPPPATRTASAATADWPGLRTRSIIDWPAFALKLNPLGFPPATRVGESDLLELTRFGATAAPSAAQAPVVALAQLVRELLGVPANSLGPVAALNGDANAVLRRALDPAAGSGGSQSATAFPSTASFWGALRSAANVSFGSVVDEDELDSAKTIRSDAAPALPSQLTTTGNPLDKGPVLSPSSPGGPGRQHARKIILYAVGALALLLTLAGGSWWLWGTKRSQQQSSEQKKLPAANDQSPNDLRQREEERKRESEAADRQLAARNKAQEEERQREPTPAASPKTNPSPRSITTPTQINANFFYDKLADEGTWYNTSAYGDVWQPKVAKYHPDWRPYTDGSWAPADQGWLWISNESFGWATYHYGRWVNNIQGLNGWVWVPGYEWASSWVSWRVGDGQQAAQTSTSPSSAGDPPTSVLNPNPQTFSAANYQVTGIVRSFTNSKVIVQKNSEQFELELNSLTKISTPLQNGQRVTVQYQMRAVAIGNSGPAGSYRVTGKIRILTDASIMIEIGANNFEMERDKNTKTSSTLHLAPGVQTTVYYRIKAIRIEAH